MTASESGKQLARAAATAFGGTPSVVRYYDSDESHHIDILRCSGAPQQGYETFSTLGLSDYVNHLDGQQVAVELVVVGRTEDEALPKALSTAAFNVMKDGWLAAPGVVFPDLLATYDLSATLPHVVWMPPTPWPSLASLSVEGEPVHWLLALPLAENERQALNEHGYDHFQSTVAENLDYFDLTRTPRL